MDKKIEEAKKLKEAAEKGEEVPAAEEPPALPALTAGHALAVGEEKKEEEPEEEEEEEEPADEEMEEPAEPPKVELTAEEKKEWFRKNPVKDLSDYALGTSFAKFSVPDQEEGFDEIDFIWQKEAQCKDYVKTWVRDRKMTTRIEDLTPGEWFKTLWSEWQKALQVWRQKNNAFKTALQKKEAEKRAKVLAKQQKAKMLAAKKAAKAKEEAEKAEAAKNGETKAEGEEEKKEEKDAEMKPAEEEEEEAEEAEEVEEEDDRIDFEKLDVFGVEDILDVGAGEPLISHFDVEDWSMMGLRFEMHLLAHAFRRDVNDPDILGIRAEHLGFYYQKYFHKALNPKLFGAETVQEMLEHIRDTVVLGTKDQVLEAQIPESIESMGIFAMLTEECRRDRTRRIELGDESAKLKLATPAAVQMGGFPGAGAGPRPTGVQPASRSRRVR